MALREVSASTKIPVSKLQAIERDDIESLPGGIFTRGFVRSYADAVGLDPQETLAKFEKRFPDESSVATLHATIEGPANEEFARRQRAVKKAVWFGLLVVPLALWLLSVIPAGETPPAATVSSEAGLPAAVSSEAELPAAVSSEAALSAAPVPESPSPGMPSVPVGSAGRPDSPPVATAAPGGLTVEISPTADCWVLASADGDTVISRVVGAGEREVVVAEEVIDLRIGNAGAFSFTINQRPGRSLGASGEVVDARVTPANYLSFVAE